MEPTTQQTFLDKEVELPYVHLRAQLRSKRCPVAGPEQRRGFGYSWGGPLLPYRMGWRCCAGCNDAEADDVWGETCVEGGSCASGTCEPVPFAARAYSASGTQKIFEDAPLPEYVVDATDGRLRAL